MERRERLRKVVAQQDAEMAEAPMQGQIIVEELAPSSELFYTEGSDELKAVRGGFAQYSLKQAYQRIAGAKRRRDDPALHKVGGAGAGCMAAACMPAWGLLKNTLCSVSSVVVVDVSSV